MDTIIYLYHNREHEKFIIEKWQKKEYCLIRLGIPVLLWKNLKALEQGLEESNKEWKSAQERQVREKWFAGRKRKRRKHEKASQVVWVEQGEQLRQEEQAERLRKEAELHELQKEILSLLTELSELQTVLRLLGENPDWTYCVYEDFLREKIDTSLWWNHWSLPYFSEYHEWIWVEELMKYATRDSFLILGYAPCVGRLLNGHVSRLRNVKWILKPEQYTEAVQELTEEIYQEYGLAVTVQLLAEEEDWLRFRPSCEKAVNVLDFSGEEKISACDIAKGSIWLDMNSLEGKEHRMEVRYPQISYFSLKKHWKQLQKTPCPP